MSMEGEIATTCAVGDRDGHVILEFPKAVQWAAFDPETARQIGEAIAKAAYKVHTGIEINDTGQRSSIIADEVRTKLLTRATHIVRSLRDNKKIQHGQLAAQIVDSILAEVT